MKRQLSTRYMKQSTKLFTFAIFYEAYSFFNGLPNLLFIVLFLFSVDLSFNFFAKSFSGYNTFWLIKCFQIFGGLDNLISNYNERVSILGSMACVFAYVLFLNFLALNKTQIYGLFFLLELFLLQKYYSVTTFGEFFQCVPGFINKFHVIFFLQQY